MAFELGRTEVPVFTDEALTALEYYAWPGNVRELKNVVERAVYRAESALISEIIVDPFRAWALGRVPRREEGPREAEPNIASCVKERLNRKPFAEAVREVELQLLRSALQEAKYNQRRAAHILGLTYHQLRALYRKYRSLSEETK